MVQHSDVIIPNGAHPLTGTLTAPAQPRAALVIHGATGVPSGYYRNFATWAAEERELAVLTYDYSGFGRSLSGHMRNVTRTMADWALEDQQAAMDWLADQVSAPLWVMGHSLGGFTLPFHKGQNRVKRFRIVASGHVNVRDHPMPYQLAARLLWYGHGPLLVRALGYLPGKASGLGADLPGSVYWQWRHWCTYPPFYKEDPTMPAPDIVGLPDDLKLISFTDDKTCPLAPSRRLLTYFRRPNAVEVVSPADHGLDKIGHIAAFHRRNSAVWPLLID